MKSNMRILSLIVFSIMTCILFFFLYRYKKGERNNLSDIRMERKRDIVSSRYIFHGIW